MVAVHLWSSLTRFTGGEKVVEVEAATAGEALRALTKAHPGLGPIIEAGVSVVIDGEMAPGLNTPVSAENEVYLMQRLKGG